MTDALSAATQSLAAMDVFPIRGSIKRVGASTVVLGLLALTALATLVQMTSPNLNLLSHLGWKPSVNAREPWRLVTWLFPQEYGLPHLVLNGFALYLYGPYLERTLGAWRTLMLYLLAGVFAGAWSTAVAPPGIGVAGGASSAVFAVFGGLFGCGLLIAVSSGDYAPLARTGIVVGGLMIFMLPLTVAAEVYLGEGFDPAIAIWGPIGHSPGLVAGIILGFAFLGSMDPTRGALWSGGAAGAVALATIVFLTMSWAPWPLWPPK